MKYDPVSWRSKGIPETGPPYVNHERRPNETRGRRKTRLPSKVVMYQIIIMTTLVCQIARDRPKRHTGASSFQTNKFPTKATVARVRRVCRCVSASCITGCTAVSKEKPPPECLHKTYTERRNSPSNLLNTVLAHFSKSLKNLSFPCYSALFRPFPLFQKIPGKW